MSRLRALPLRVATAGPRGIALAWAAATFLALAALSGGPGVSRAEGAVIGAGGRIAGFWAALPAHPLNAIADVDATFGGEHAAGPLVPTLAAPVHAGARLVRLPHVVGWRLLTALAAALLSALVATLGHALAGPAGGWLAPALLWLAPRSLALGASATPDVALAALWLCAVAAYRRAAHEPVRRLRLRAAALAGLCFGAALAARPDAWVLLPALALHAAAVRALRPRGAPGVDAGEPGDPSELELKLHGVPVALAAMAVLGPLVLVALWPWLWRDPTRLLAAFAPARGALAGGVRAALAAPWAALALATPVAIGAAFAGGLVHAAGRLVRAARGALPAAVLSDEALLLAAALAPLVAAGAGLAPGGGIRASFAALPVLSLLGARALLSAAALAWPARARALAAALALLALWPAARATVHAWPDAGSAWGELAGGAPGAASLGLPRQGGGEAVARVLAELNARARPGARVWWPRVAPEAVALYAADGRVRPDLGVASGPYDADLAVVPVDGADRDQEYQVRAAFRTARPAAGAFLDEVPLAWVYARPGAWR